MTANEKIPTGCKGLDRLLNGGFGKGEMSLIYGEAATGKTTMAIQVAVTAAKMGSKVLFLDADHSFTPQRLHQIAGVQNEKISPFILLFFPETFSEQRRIVESLESYVTPSLGLIIIDSMSSLYRAAFSGSESVFNLNRDLARQAAYLSEFSSSHKLVCILTDQVHARLTPPVADVEPVARRTLSYFPQNIIRLRNTPRPSVKEILLEKAGSSDKNGTSCLAVLGEPGFSDLSS